MIEIQVCCLILTGLIAFLVLSGRYRSFARRHILTRVGRKLAVLKVRECDSTEKDEKRIQAEVNQIGRGEARWWPGSAEWLCAKPYDGPYRPRKCIWCKAKVTPE